MIIDRLLDGLEHGMQPGDNKYIYDMAMSCNMYDLARALDGGSNSDIQVELIKYVAGNYGHLVGDLTPLIISYDWTTEYIIKSVSWYKSTWHDGYDVFKVTYTNGEIYSCGKYNLPGDVGVWVHTHDGVYYYDVGDGYHFRVVYE